MEEKPGGINAVPISIDRSECIQTVDDMSWLQQWALALLNASTVAQVADAIISEGVLALHATMGELYLLTDDGAHLEAVRTFGLPAESARQYERVPLTAPIPIAEAVRQGKLILLGATAVHSELPDSASGPVQAFSRQTHSEDAPPEKARPEQVAHAIIPLKTLDRIVGAISITFTDRDMLGAAECAWLETIAQLGAPALERARQYEAERCARELAESRLEQKKQESDEHARDFFGSLTDGFVGYDRQWRIMYVNAAAAAVVHMPEEALTGRVVWEVFPDLVGSPYDAACQQAMNEHIPIHRADFWPRFDIWVENHIFPVYEGVAVMFRDITAARRSEEALRAAERQLRLVTDASPILISYVDAKQRLQFVNRAFAAWHGAPTEQIVGKTIQEVLHPEIYEFVAGYIDRALSGQTVTYERSVLDGAGNLRHIYATYVPDINTEGEVRGFVGVGTDITERKKLEMRLREETESLETINRLGQRLSAELDLEKLVQDATDGATKLTGAQFGAFFYNVIAPGDESYMLYTISGVQRELFSRFPMPRNTALFAPTFAGEGTVRLDDVARDPRYGKNAPFYGKPHGHLPVVSYLAVPVVSRSGEVLGGLFLGHEQPGVFTKRHERIVEGLAAQAAIAIDNARLFLAERERSDQLGLAISEVHHRVKNSLQAVAALLEMQIPDEESVMPVEAARDSLSQIKTIALVHDLLAHDKPIGIVDIAKVLTNLAKLLAEGMRVDDRPLPIHVDAEPVEMPTKSATSLALIVNELLTNAAKHNVGGDADTSGDMEPIQVRLIREDENIVVLVRDHGPGFAPDFDLGQHAHIGLQLVQTLVRHDLRGRVQFGNELAADGARIAGARIEISFPLSSLME